MEYIVPVQFYSLVFYHIVLLVVFGMVLKLYKYGYAIETLGKRDLASPVLLLVILLYMGLRPISGKYFVDMGIYYKGFMNFAEGKELTDRNDYLWYAFVKFCSGFMSAKVYFFTCAAFYIVPLYKASKNWLYKDSYVVFLMLVASFSFWGYGTNGIRNGIATSIFVLGLSYAYKNRYLHVGLLSLSYFIHGSMIIPLSAFILSCLHKNPRTYIIGWILAVPLSLVLGSRLELFFMSLGIGGDRVGYLVMTGLDNVFAYSGFRWDFLIYSFVPVYAGYYYIIRNNFDDKIYKQIFNIYVIANTFWVMIIRASFSNRFAYLSWFLMAIVIFYPLFKRRFFRYQQFNLIYFILLYFGFTYIMFWKYELQN
ncbi:EpsG family protein [Carboxylicivirga marina]|uniref:EpsG family protein n=1 Tax=Carboxylicivirga marina TaxID=2800988 RepID=UPI002598AB35|nr:EpsG family protein [uncultured Carboxylicivirga sp.]